MRILLLASIIAALLTPQLQAAPLLSLDSSSTVVSFGDSTTAPRSGVTVYSTILNQELPYYGLDATVINSGVPGNTSSDGMARFQSDVRSYNPDLVIVQFGINDSAWDVWKNPPATGPRVDLATYTANLINAVQTLKADGAQVILMTPNALRWTDTTLGLYGSSPYDPNDPMGFNATITPYCQAVRDLAAAESVPLVDVYNMFVDYDAVSGQSMDDLLLDGMHPNNQGQQMVADALLSVITDGLTKSEVLPLTPKDSLTFAHAYEANSDLPTIEDSGAGKTNWAFFDHAAVDAGYAVSDGALSYSTMPDSIGGDWFYSSAGVSGSAWAAEIAAGTSYTLEFRAKVTESIGSSPGLHVVTSDGADKIWLNITEDRIGTSDGYAVSTKCFGDNASDYHTFRMAYDGVAGSFTIWRDDVRIAENVAATTTGDVYLGLGDMSSSGSATASIDYFRWDATGAYAPETEVIPTYTPPSATMDSANFDYKYEMDVDPTNPALVDYDSNGVADWSNWSGSSTTVSFSDGKMIMPDGSALDGGIENADTLWPTQGFTAAEGFTFEVSLQVLSQTISREDDPTASAIVFAFALSDSDEICPFFVGEDSVAWWYQEGDLFEESIDNTDGQHTYRVSRDSNADGGRWWFWRDGELLTPEGSFSQKTYVRDAAYFGPAMSSSTSGSVAIDYIRMAEGAFSPEEEVKIPGDANGDGKVDGSDVTILAGNWQKGVSDGLTASWGEGDFNGDGKVDGSDVTILAGNWQYGVTAAAAAVPEPSTIVLLLVGIASVGLLRRRSFGKS